VLMTALAAGNCVFVKPSELAPHSSNVIAEIVKKYLNPNCYTVVEGGIEVSKNVLTHKFDHIVFIGGTEKGKIVARAAAEHLTPITLELGGKSPAIVDGSGSLDLAAKRICHLKLFNAG